MALAKALTKASTRDPAMKAWVELLREEEGGKFCERSQLEQDRRCQAALVAMAPGLYIRLVHPPWPRSLTYGLGAEWYPTLARLADAAVLSLRYFGFQPERAREWHVSWC